MLAILLILLAVIPVCLVWTVDKLTKKTKKDLKNLKWLKYLVPLVCFLFSLQYIIQYLKVEDEGYKKAAAESSVPFIVGYIIATLLSLFLCLYIDATKKNTVKKETVKPKTKKPTKKTISK